MVRQPGPAIAIVANRGPNDFVWRNGSWVTRKSSGGLVSLLVPLARRTDVAWFCCVSEPPDAQQARRGLFTTARDQADPSLHVVPVPLSAATYHAYYGQLSNEVLWMLQHRLVGPGGLSAIEKPQHAAWDAYLHANRVLADAVTNTFSAPGAVLVQDYHLYPLPALLRESFPSTPLLHFTHIPFPEPALFRLLPAAWRTVILNGLLGANVAGFQTPDDVQAFLACCAEFLHRPIDRARGHVAATDGRVVAVRAYPASVDPRALHRTMTSQAVRSARERLAALAGDLTIVRVDRLDPSKNQVVGFRAFGRLLETRPDLRPRLRFLAFLVPSRTDLQIYREYRDAVYAAIEEINQRYAADCGGEPITVFYTNDREQALAGMELCDVLLVNSLEDGMNLVAKEWAVVARRPSALVVSETAGVATEAAEAGFLVSPLDVEGTARALAQAIDASASERAERLRSFRARINQWTAWHWLNAQMADLGLDPDLTRR